MSDQAPPLVERSERVAALLALAREAQDRNDPAGALALVDQILGEFPAETAALDLGSRLAADFGSDQHKVRYGAMRLALLPDKVAARRALGAALSDAGAHEAAGDVRELLVAKRAGSSTRHDDAIRTLLACRSRDAMGQFLGQLAQDNATDEALVERVADYLVALEENELLLNWVGHAWNVPLGHDTQFLRGRLLYQAGRHGDAIPNLEHAASESPNPRHRLSANLFLARIAFRDRRMADAQQAYRRVHESNSENEEAAEALVRHALANRQVQSASSVLARFEEAAPSSPVRVWLKAAIEIADGQTASAVALYRDAIASDPGHVEYSCRFADLLADIGEYKEMSDVLHRAAERAPDSPRVFVRQVRAAQLQDNPSQLLELCENFLLVQADNETAILHRASALLRLGRRSEAMEQYLEGARRHGRNVNFWRSAASLATSLSRQELTRTITDEAAAIFDRAVLDDLVARAEILEAAGMAERALQAAQSALAIDPASIVANQIAARLFAAGGSFDRAWPHLVFLKAGTDRSAATTRLFAQVAAGFRYLRPSQADLLEIEPIGSRFPDVLFDEIVSRSTPLSLEQCTDRIMHVSSSLAAGGAERQVALTVEALAANGKAVEFVADDLAAANGRDFFLPVVERSGVPVHLLRTLRERGSWRDLLACEPERREAIRVLGALPRDMAQLALPLFTLFCERKPAVVHLWQDMIAVAGGIAAVLAGVPRIVIGVRSTRPIEQQRARPYFHAAYQALLRRPGVSIIANSQSGARDYENWLHLREGHVLTLHNGYDFGEMLERAEPRARQRVRAENAIPDDALVLGGVMRCSFEKRPELWTDVACGLALRDPRVHGILVGDGPMREELIDRIASRGLSNCIRLVGRKTPVEPWMKAMDVLFLTSITEGLPNVLIEAQALGVAVATMRVGGAPETVREGVTAAVIDEGSIEQLCDTVSGLLFDSAQREAYGREGIAWTQEAFSIDALVGRLCALYEGAA